MNNLHETQFRAQAVMLYKENYSYSVIAKKLDRSKAWVKQMGKSLESESH